MEMYNIQVGQVLWTKNGDSVVVFAFSDKEIIVEYRGKRYKRPRHDVGVRLMPEPQKTKPKQTPA